VEAAITRSCNAIVQCNRGDQDKKLSQFDLCAYFSINPLYSSKAGNFSNLWGAGVLAHGSFSLVYVSMKGEKRLGSSSIVARTLTKSNPSGRVNIQLMQWGQK
jgi:hypothetical protein